MSRKLYKSKEWGGFVKLALQTSTKTREEIADEIAVDPHTTKSWQTGFFPTDENIVAFCEATNMQGSIEAILVMKQKLFAKLNPKPKTFKSLQERKCCFLCKKLVFLRNLSSQCKDHGGVTFVTNYEATLHTCYKFERR